MLITSTINGAERSYLQKNGENRKGLLCALIVWILLLCALTVWSLMTCSMDDMHRMAQRNAMLVHGLDWSERRAGIFEPAPTDELAVATTLGLVLNCLSSGLYMVSSLQHISWQPLLLLPDV